MKSLLIRNVVLNGKPADILVRGNRISRIGRNLEDKAGRTIDGRGMTALPPLINGHTHAAMTLLRGYADDMGLMEWLQTKIWPFEGRLTKDDVLAGSRLACLEMIKSGATFFNDMYWHWHATADAVEEMGLRALLSPVFIDGGDEARGETNRRMVEEIHGGLAGYSGRVRFALGPHAIYTVSSDNLRFMKEFARARNVPIHIHLSETADEVQTCLKSKNLRPVEYLDSIGFLGPEVFAAHCVHLAEKEIDLLAANRVKAIHIPVSNLKLAVGGIMPLAALTKAGVSVLIGTDGCSSNNCLDMFQTLKFAALMAKHKSGDPTSMPAHEAWAMATTDAARAFGLDLGIEEGRLADLILVDRERPEFVPGYNLYSDLVYSANGYCVDTVLCDGRVLMSRRKVPGEKDIIDDARRVARRLCKAG